MLNCNGIATSNNRIGYNLNTVNYNTIPVSMSACCCCCFCYYNCFCYCCYVRCYLAGEVSSCSRCCFCCSGLDMTLHTAPPCVVALHYTTQQIPSHIFRSKDNLWIDSLVWNIPCLFISVAHFPHSTNQCMSGRAVQCGTVSPTPNCGASNCGILYCSVALLVTWSII